jgi:hypothetical protein
MANDTFLEFEAPLACSRTNHKYSQVARSMEYISPEVKSTHRPGGGKCNLTPQKCNAKMKKCKKCKKMQKMQRKCKKSATSKEIPSCCSKKKKKKASGAFGAGI